MSKNENEVNQVDLPSMEEYSDIRAAYGRLVYDTIRDYQNARNQRDFSAANWCLDDLHGLVISWSKDRYDERIKNFIEQLEELREYYDVEEDEEYYTVAYKKYVSKKFQILCEIMSETGLLHGKSTTDILEESRNNLIVRWFKQKTRMDSNAFVFVQGSTGYGKSFAALNLAEQVDPAFNPENQIVFYKDKFAEIIKSTMGISDAYPPLKKGQVIVWDEVGQNMHSQKWQDETVRFISNNLETMRKLGVHVIFTAPMMEFFEGRARKLLHLRITMQRPREKGNIYYGVPQIPQQLIYKRDDPVRWISFSYGGTKLDKILFRLPKEEILSVYKPMKDEFNKKVAQQEDYVEKEEYIDNFKDLITTQTQHDDKPEVAEAMRLFQWD